MTDLELEQFRLAITSLSARYRAAEQRFEGGRAMRKAFRCLATCDLLGHTLQFRKSCLHFEAAAKFDECAAVGQATGVAPDDVEMPGFN